MRELMNTREVADYLRLKERKVYDLVRTRSIPCTRLTGKWLFPKTLIDLWVIRHTDYQADLQAVWVSPRVIAGSHDPLLEWALREAECDCATQFDGSLDGVRRLAARQAMVCGLHVLDPAAGQYNVDLAQQLLAGFRVVLLEWARREQGLVLAPGNPHDVSTLTDLRNRKLRVVERQHTAGSHVLLKHLLEQASMSRDDLNLIAATARSETDVAVAVVEGKADAGIAIAAVARQFRLDFVPLHRERYDLAIARRDYFEPPFQQLLQFARSPRFIERARELGGYDVSALGQVVYNAP
ncbi:MAG: substrate-binding domain-containing protein [Gammaproteobacteria bacterium]